MPTVLSKASGLFNNPLTHFMAGSPQRKALSVSILCLVLYLIKIKLSKNKSKASTDAKPAKKEKKRRWKCRFGLLQENQSST